MIVKILKLSFDLTMAKNTTFKKIIICADNDTPGLNAANELKARMIKQKRKCRIIKPKLKGDDWNDVLMREAA